MCTEPLIPLRDGSEHCPNCGFTDRDAAERSSADRRASGDVEMRLEMDVVDLLERKTRETLGAWRDAPTVFDAAAKESHLALALGYATALGRTPLPVARGQPWSGRVQADVRMLTYRQGFTIAPGHVFAIVGRTFGVRMSDDGDVLQADGERQAGCAHALGLAAGFLNGAEMAVSELIGQLQGSPITGRLEKRMGG